MLNPRILAFVLLAAAAASAQDVRVPYEQLVQQAEKFEGISPPPPPMESTLVGTLDAATGVFTWGPAIERRYDLSSLVRDIGKVFDARGIRATVVSLEPVLGSFDDLGLAVDLARLRAPAVARARPAPGRRSGEGAVAQGATSGGLQGHSNERLSFAYFARAAKVGLVFEVANAPKGVRPTLAVRGKPFKMKGTSAGVVVPPCAHVDFTVSCGSVKFADRLYIDRPPIFGFFTLEALPVAIVYEPPGPASEQTYTTIQQVGTVLRSIASKTDTGYGEIPTRFSEINGYLDSAKTVGELAAKVPNPYVAAAGKAVAEGAGALKSLIGNVEVDETIAHTVTDEHELSVQFVSGQSLGTNSHAGPGKGDVLHYLIKPVFGWLAVPAEDDKIRITLALLGYRRTAAHDADTMRSGVLVEPRAEVLKQLLALDPLTPESLEMPPEVRIGRGFGPLPRKLLGATGPGANPAVGRFIPRYGDEIEFSGANLTRWCRETIEESDTRTEMRMRTVTTKSTAGYLSYISEDVPKDDENSVTTVHGSAAKSSVSQTVEVMVHYESISGQVIYIRSFYDTAFGTFGFVEFQPTADAQVTGEVADDEGVAASGQPITIDTGEGSTTVFTDEKGRFSFRSPLLGAGKHTLLAGGERLPIELAGKLLEIPKIVASRAALDEAKRRATNPAAGSQDLSYRIAGILAHLDGLEKRVDTLQSAIASAASSGEAAGPAKPKGRLGKLIVTFPKDSQANDEVSLYADGEDEVLTWSNGGLERELVPGKYRVGVHKARTFAFDVARGQNITARLGALRINAAPGTEWQLFPPGGKEALTWGKGPKAVGLIPGDYDLEIGGQRTAVKIQSDKIEEF